MDASRRADFFRLHSAERGGGWCFCVAWWVPTWDGWGERTAEENRRLRESLFDRGELDGYLAYEGDAPVGWCQVGPRDRLVKLARQMRLEPEPAAVAISCFHVAPAHRRRGVARRMLDEVLRDLRARGVRRVEAFPRRGADLPEDDLWTGPEALFCAAGFTIARDDPARPVLALDL
jgi:ribosomal protein S18 acetylase RimI-like enzyme